jgi:hypothetical protein
MINIFIIFLTQYFPKQKGEPMIKIFLFNQRVQGLIFFSNSLFLLSTKWMEKKAFGQFFQARCPREKRIFPWEETKW